MKKLLICLLGLFSVVAFAQSDSTAVAGPKHLVVHNSIQGYSWIKYRTFWSPSAAPMVTSNFSWKNVETLCGKTSGDCLVQVMVTKGNDSNQQDAIEGAKLKFNLATGKIVQTYSNGYTVAITPYNPVTRTDTVSLVKSH